MPIPQKNRIALPSLDIDDDNDDDFVFTNKDDDEDEVDISTLPELTDSDFENETDYGSIDGLDDDLPDDYDENDNYIPEDLPDYDESDDDDDFSSEYENEPQQPVSRKKKKIKKPLPIKKIGIGLVVVILLATIGFVGYKFILPKISQSPQESNSEVVANNSIDIVNITDDNTILVSVKTSEDASGFVQLVYNNPRNSRVIVCESLDNDFSADTPREVDLACYNNEFDNITDLEFVKSTLITN